MTRARTEGQRGSEADVMMKLMAMASVLAAAVLAASVTVRAQGQPTPRPHFSLAFRATSTDIFLLCEEGCRWESLRFAAADTPVVFDDQGLLSERTERGPGGSGFVMSVRAVGRKLELQCRSGCRWAAMIAEPRFEVHRVDEHGRSWRAPDSGNQASQFPARWQWPAVGSTMRVRIREGERIDAENVMIPDPVERRSAGMRPIAPFGGIVSATLTSMGTMYAGHYSSAEPCFYTDSDFAESRGRCRFQTAIEITLLTPTKIEGQAETDFAFDCRSCRITGKPRMKPFVWIPVR
jgi:hypothetical protein